MEHKNASEGLVVRIKGAGYFVASGPEEVRCVLRGRFRIQGALEAPLPVVGDLVRFRKERSGDAREPGGVITHVMPRKSVLARTEASSKKGFQVLGANMDRAILVFSITEPTLNFRLLDRMLVAAECGSMEAVVCVNKMDLAENRSAVDAELDPYRVIGCRVILCSAKTGDGVGELEGIMKDSLTILAGPSGSGKTSLISRIQPGLGLAIGHVSARTGKGRHTTTHFELHRLDIGGYLGDTPGVREFGIRGITRERLWSFFREFAPFGGGCRFAGCTHTHEPDCSVKEAVERGLVSRSRYESYLRIFETLPDERAAWETRGGGGGRRGAR
jgi:ribosome biogenesis GTPase